MFDWEIVARFGLFYLFVFIWNELHRRRLEREEARFRQYRYEIIYGPEEERARWRWRRSLMS